jgi:hypothetical protein
MHLWQKNDKICGKKISFDSSKSQQVHFRMIEDGARWPRREGVFSRRHVPSSWRQAVFQADEQAISCCAVSLEFCMSTLVLEFHMACIHLLGKTAAISLKARCLRVYKTVRYGLSKICFEMMCQATLPSLQGVSWPVHLNDKNVSSREDTFLPWHLAPASGGHTLPF